ncbi:hypothetical protein QN277_028543 [Acacia crassicarpa]|uniref:tRNA/rRNA methyltransferase SpoU type domain-containing protein n=1 Tax=Acacia crassicarpa TaxID=499986 RepID=A0AAE1J7J5_9FABA|nr:hypothetical protein QN277_028543 [Acacia crassicarpa]
MLCSYPQWTSIFCPQPQAFKKSSFQSRLSVAPPQTRKEGSSDYNDVEYGDNFGSEDDILDAISDAKSKFITSAKNPFVKHCIKLRNDSSYRRYHGSVLVVGSTPIREIYRFQESLQDNNITMDCLILPDKTEVPEGLDKSPLIMRVSSTVMKKLARLQSTDSLDAIALMKIPNRFFSLDENQDTADCWRWFSSPHRILVLERIQDPGNLGTLLRSAVAFGWDGVFLLPGCSDPFNDKALRASRGASFQLPIVSGGWVHLESLIEQFQMKLLGGHPEDEVAAKPVYRISPSFCDSVSDKPLCLVLGSEGSGLSEKSMQACELVSIPMAGEFESLNVSVAGGIFLYMLQPKCR